MVRQCHHCKCGDPVAYGRETVTLPLSAKLTAHDVDDVIQAVGRVLAAA